VAIAVVVVVVIIIIIIIIIITDGNLTLTKRLIKKILYLHNQCEKGKGRVRGQ
jgi:hypothetical protein